MSSIRPDVARQVAAAGADRGLRCLDAPVSGGEKGAIDGTLSIMVGGAAGDVAAARPVLDVLGSTVQHVGPAGAGQTVKAANQLIVAGNIALVAEALVFLQAQGVDMDAAVAVLQGGLAGSTVLARKAASMLSGDFTPGFRIELHDKDLAIFTAAAREAGVVTLLGALLAQLTGAARAQGDGGLDHSALMRVIQRLGRPAAVSQQAVAGPAVSDAAAGDWLAINTIRTLTIDAVQAAQSGHPGAAMALAPVGYTLWNDALRYDVNDPGG